MVIVAVLEFDYFRVYILQKILKLNFRERKENAWEDSDSDELFVVFSWCLEKAQWKLFANMSISF
jgi:hypothetical protein